MSHVRFCHHVPSKQCFMEPSPSAPPPSHASSATPRASRNSLHHHQENPRLPPRVDGTPESGPKPHRLGKASRSQCLGNRHRFLHAPKLRKLSYVQTKQAKSEQTKTLNTQHPPSLAESLHHSWRGSKCSFLIQKSLLRS